MSKKNKFLIFVIGASIPLWIIWRIAMVSFDYSSVGEPQSGVKITLREIGGQTALVFPEEENYIFDKVRLKIDLTDNSLSQKEVKIKAYQNFLISFYPKQEKNLSGEDIQKMLFENNKTNIPVGGLFALPLAVNILLPENSYQSIFSAELFEKMGYQWEDVIEKDPGFVGELEDKGSWNYGWAYSDGTVVESKGEKFLVWRGELWSIDPQVDTKKYTGNFPIKIETLKANPFAECQANITKNQLECVFEQTTQNQKSNYIFILSGLGESDIEKASLNLSTTSKGDNLKSNLMVSIENIKLKLIKKYRGHIPFI